MLIDVDKVLQTAKPWDLRMQIDGRQFSVRRLSNADFKRLNDAGVYTEAENRLFVIGLFDEGDRATVAQWDAERTSAATGVVMNYYQLSVIRKNGQMLAQAVAAALSIPAEVMAASGLID